MNKSLGNLLLLAVGALLLGYTAFRSVDILSRTLPADAQVLAYVGLAGLDGGLIAWVVYRMKSARGDWQNAISTVMVVIQLAGVALTSVGDSLMNTIGADMPGYILIAVTWGVPGIIALNVAAITAVHMTDPANEIERAKREQEDEIQKATAQQIRANAASLASGVAPHAASHLQKQMLAQFGASTSSNNGQGKGRDYALEVPASTAVPAHLHPPAGAVSPTEADIQAATEILRRAGVKVGRRS